MAQKIVPQSPENYIKSGNVRKLSLYECWVNEDHIGNGIATVFITRQHKNNNYTGASFLIDMFCLGVKDSMYFFNIDEENYQTRVIQSGLILEKTDYSYAHNLVFGAYEYALELGISPHKSFAITQHILEEDNDAIDIIEFEFGKEGKPFLVINPNDNRDKELKILERTQGTGNYDFIKHIDSFEDDEDDFDEEDDEDDFEEDDDDIDYDNIEEIENDINDNDNLFYINYSDLKSFEKIELIDQITNESEKIETLQNYFENDENMSDFFVHKHADDLFDTVFTNYQNTVNEVTFKLPFITEDNKKFHNYPANLNKIDDDFINFIEEFEDSGVDEEDLEKKASEKLALKYDGDEAFLVFLINLLEFDEEAENALLLAINTYYQQFPNSINAQALYLANFIESNISVDPAEENLDIKISELPFKIAESTKFSATSKNPHICEVTGFLFMQAINYLVNNKLNCAETCLREMAILRVKHTNYFMIVRNLITAEKTKKMHAMASSHLKIVK